MYKYDHKKIEEKWQSRWRESNAFVVKGGVEGAAKAGKAGASSEKTPYYVLEMFPYPSGKIHMGHVRNYSIGDVVARFKRMKGFDVLHPMGWDSFGLPAENAAIERGVRPKEWTLDNIDNMRIQLKRMGLSYDWSREIATCTPEYYRWNQWLFVKLFESGLAYKKRASVNWCDKCLTVLANEQVEDGLCWRCESAVIQKELDQWFFKITDYAEELLEYTEKLPGWPERVLTMQKNWIGKSVGAEVDFPLEGAEDSIKIFTTRPDTLYGVTFMSLAAEHPLVDKITTEEQREEVLEFVESVKNEDQPVEGEELEKRGVFTGAYCVNPLSGDKIPVYVANFVLMGYGTGAVMAVPAHDQRDFEFARKYELPIKVVINPDGQELDVSVMEEAYTSEGVMVNSGPFDGTINTEGKAKVIELLEEEGKGEKAVTYRLRDWGISRQRYWGCPIPIIYCDKCGTVPVPAEDLPVKLPENIDFKALSGLSPLESVEDFVNVPCPKCKGSARREVDTMDTFVDSSWYFLRYLSADNTEQPVVKEMVSKWMPVDQYIGGIEHAVMHLLYARFFTKALRDLGLIDIDEPIKNLLTQGMVCMETLKCATDGYLLPEEVKDNRCSKCGGEVERGAVEKMSKSKKNTIDPDGIIKRYGADTTRLFSLFAAPPEKDLDWNVDGVDGSYRFIGRVWRLVTDNLEMLKGVKPYAGDAPLEGGAEEVHRSTHRTIKKVTGDVERRFHFNTAISAIMEHVNLLYKWEPAQNEAVFREAVEATIVLLSPFAPHVTEELWELIGGEGVLHNRPWPTFDESAIATEEVLVVVQINGKVRAKVIVPAGADKETAEAVVVKNEDVVKWTEGKTVVKTIYIQDKIFNMVVK